MVTGVATNLIPRPADELPRFIVVDNNLFLGTGKTRSGRSIGRRTLPGRRYLNGRPNELPVGNFIKSVN